MTYVLVAIIAVSRHHIKLHAACGRTGHVRTETVNSSLPGMLESLPGTGMRSHAGVPALDWKWQSVLSS